jgi:MSHA biogenesis protein MshQ
VGVAIGTTNGSLDTSIGTLYVGDNRSSATPSGATSRSANGYIDELRVYNYELSAVELSADMSISHSCAPPLHHLEIRHASGSGLTCTPATLTLVACADSACSSTYTSGLTGTLTASGTGMTVNWPDGAGFTIAAGSSSVSLRMQPTTVGSVTVGSSGLSTTPSSGTTCNFGSPSCTFSTADSGLLFDVPNHAAETSQSFTVSAVKKADNSLACVPAFASVSKPVNFKCNYGNPTTGSAPVRIGGSSVACAANGASTAGTGVTLAFDATGKATTSLLYADAGQITLTATYTGSGSDAGLSMTGSDSFIAAPASLAFSALTSGNIKAGNAFSATVTALNSAGAAMGNFGKETSPATVSLAFTRRTPTGTNANGVAASDGSFSGSLGSFSGGAATASNLSWTEVGTGDLTASVSNYLGSGLSASGATGSGGAVHVIPHHFNVVVTSQGCGSFTYAGGQTFSTTVTAQNAANANTVNYDGSFGSPVSRAVTLADASALGGTISTGPHIAASVFRLGIGTGTASYGFASKQTAEKTLLLSASDTDGATSVGTTQTGNSTTLRSGRLRVANGFGSEKSALLLAVLAEYWSGNAWVLNSADSCTTVPAASVALSNYRDKTGAAVSTATQWTTTASAVALTSGQGTLTLSAPSSGRTGTVDLALNLGSSAVDQSCLANHPASTAGNLAWLRSRFGNCAATFDRDPSAQATFGVYSPETKKTVHVREIF